MYYTEARNDMCQQGNQNLAESGVGLVFVNIKCRLELAAMHKYVFRFSGYDAKINKMKKRHTLWILER